MEEFACQLRAVEPNETELVGVYQTHDRVLYDERGHHDEAESNKKMVQSRHPAEIEQALHSGDFGDALRVVDHLQQWQDDADSETLQRAVEDHQHAQDKALAPRSPVE
jgi:hypothetical protein